MGRQNPKEISVNYENSIKKSNELSMARLSQGLTLNQMQLLAFAIFSTQQDGKTEFRKFEFQNKFGLEKYQTAYARNDAKRLLGLQYSNEDIENDYFEYWNIFNSIRYREGLFSFKWNEEFMPHILELKEKYVTTDLTITSKFKSGFSWILYDYLRGHYGYWQKSLSKDACLRLFNVQDRKTYLKNTGRFKGSVLDVAIKEINTHTELEVWYTEDKTGNKITDFIFHWSTGKREFRATEKQIRLMLEIHDEVEKHVYDYLSLQSEDDREHARKNILKIKEIHGQANTPITSEAAKALIWEMKILYKQLQSLLEMDGKRVSVYYDWLSETE